LRGLKPGEGLGEWERKSYKRLFIVKPGLYWPDKPRSSEFRLKTRGLSQSVVIPRIPVFHRKWKRWLDREIAGRGRFALPVVPLMSDLFIGLRLAYRLGDLAKGAMWQQRTLNISFDWSDKRGRLRLSHDRKHVIVEALSGSLTAVSMPYRPGLARPEWADEFEADRMLVEDMPDALELTPPYID
jgi:hypothetical protein